MVAFSGGPDSVFLAESFLEQGYKKIIIAHFNHHMEMRDGANMIDEIFAKNFAEEKNIIFELGHWENSQISENKARNARYDFLETVRKKYNAKAIVTAHHKNDVAETVLLQFFRSGGLKSLTGIAEWDKNRKLWRPLLGIEKYEILEFLERKKILFCTDTSNSEDVFLRNFLRNTAIPLLETRFPNLQNHISAQADILREIDDEIEKKAESFLSDQKQNEIKRTDFFQEMKMIQISILRKILKKKSLSSAFIKIFLDFIENAQSGKKLETKFQVFSVNNHVLVYEDI